MATVLIPHDGSGLLWTALAIIGVWFMIDCWRRNRNLPPGPWSLPIVGYYFSLRQKPNVHLKNLAKSYGDVFSFRTLGGTLIIVLSSFEAVKDVLVNRFAEFIGRPFEETLMLLLDDGEGIADTEGQIWKEQRRFVVHNAKDFGFGTVAIESSAHQLIEKMMSDIRKLNGKPFEPYMHICHVTCNIISKILYSKEFVKESAEYKTIIKHVNNIIDLFTGSSLFVIGPFMKLMLKFHSLGIKAKNSKQELWSLTRDIIDEHAKNFDPTNIHDFVDAYLNQLKGLKEKGELQGSSFIRDRLDAVAIGLFLEGSGSVASSIRGYVLKLSQYSDIQKKVQEELDKEVGRGRIPSWTDRAKLPYFTAVIQELYRTSSVFVFSNLYSNYEKTKIKGYKVPKRSIIMANLYALNNDPRLYPNPEAFDPERFLDSSGKLIKDDGPFAFGVGKRACIGKPLSQMEVFFVIAALLQNFTLYPSEEGKLRAVSRDDTPV